MPRPFLSPVLLLCCLSCLLREGHGQVVEFARQPIKKVRSLELIKKFHVYSFQESPVYFGEHPSIRFEGLTLRGEGGKPLPDQTKVAVAFMSSRQFEFGDAESWCVAQDHLKANRSVEKPYLIIREPNEPSLQDESFDINETGIYILAVANCGGDPKAKYDLSGRVFVKNTFGYLPGDEFHKLLLHGLLVFLYVQLALVWSFQLLWCRKSVIHMHLAVAFLLFVAFVESASTSFYLYSRSLMGHEDAFMEMILVALTSVKHASTYSLVLATSLGWAVYKSDIAPEDLTRIRKLWVLYVLIAIPAGVCLKTIPSPPLASLCSIATFSIAGLFMYLIYSTLNSSICSLGDQRQDVKLLMCIRLRRVLCIWAVCGALAKALQVSEFLMDLGSIDWRRRWVRDLGVWQMSYVMVLVTIMWLFGPSTNDGRADFLQIDGIEADDQPMPFDDAEWADTRKDIDQEDMEEDSFWTNTRASTLPHTPQRAVIGKPYAAI